MPTRIIGDNIYVPGYIFLENPLIGAQRVLATDAGSGVVSTNVSISTLDLLQTATHLNTPNALVKRDADGLVDSPEFSGAAKFHSNIELVGDSPSRITFQVYGEVHYASLIWEQPMLIVEVSGDRLLQIGGGKVIFLSPFGGRCRISDGKFQLLNQDDSLYYELTLRTVAGVPTLSVEGAGES